MMEDNYSAWQANDIIRRVRHALDNNMLTQVEVLKRIETVVYDVKRRKPPNPKPIKVKSEK